MNFSIRSLLAASSLLFSLTNSSLAQGEAFFLSQPSLSPDGQTVFFCFEGDVWKAGVEDGKATRVTGMKGYETNPKMSPDGKWIAFTGRQFGNPDVYVMPAAGGEVRRLTHYSGSDEVMSWSWDSKSIYFTSNRLSRLSSYKVNVDGGGATPVFGRYYFLNDHNIFEHPTTGELFFNDTWESASQVHRKRYKGPYNPDIQSYNTATKQYKRFTNYLGKDFGVSIDKSGTVYFLSDSANGEYNLCTFKNGKREQLTNFNTSLKNAIVAANGSRVVFERDYQLWAYEPASGKSRKLNISLVRNNVLLEAMDYNVKGKITNFDVAKDGKKIAFISRGQLFVSDIEGKFVQQIDQQSGERKGEVMWAADSKTLIYNQTSNGYRNWFAVAADKSAQPRQITKEMKNNRSLSLNKKRTKGVFLSGRNEVKLMDLKSYEITTLIKDEIWGFDNSAPGFSPDGEYVIYTAYRNFEQDIFVHHIKTGKTINLTKTGISEMSPIWSGDGRYVYFSSSRLKPAYPMGPSNPHIYRMPLQKFDSVFYADKYNELFQDSVKKDTAYTGIYTAIDTVDIMDRVELVGHNYGSQDLLAVTENDGAQVAVYVSQNGDEKPAVFKTEYKKFENPKTEKISGAEGDLGNFVEVKDKRYMLVDGKICKVNINDGNKADPINIEYVFRKNLAEEFNQIFHETWAQVHENFYDEHFHGIDWEATKERYAKMLPFVNNRGDLRTLINDMLGELNSSHQGFNSTGDDEAATLKETTMETGILFDENNQYKVKYVVKNSPADKVNINIKAGDLLTHVNGVQVDKNEDRYNYFTRPSIDKELSLTFDRNGKSVTVIVHPQTTITTKLYDEWIDNNRKNVAEKSHNRIAYAAMKDMGQTEYEHFVEKMTQELNGKDGLILDLRYNTGGNVHDQVLQFLSQRSYLQWKYREGSLTRQPNFAPSDKPIVLLINEQSLSDAEMTAQGFKALKLGTIIGNETYHWIIFTSSASMVDGSSVRMPAWGCYTLEGKDLEVTGVAPDVRILETFEDKLNGKDAQIEAAVADIFKRSGK